jgi:glycine oxidase
MSITCDVVIVGAGIMGCAVALRLRQRGLSVTLVERAIPGAEASSAAAGILAPQVEADAQGPFLDLALRSRALYPTWIQEIQALTGLDVGYRTEGTLALGPLLSCDPAAIETGMAALRSRMAWQRQAGLRVSFLDQQQLRDAEPALHPCAGALHFPDDHQVEAPLLCRALSQAAALAGARFVTAHVQRVLLDPDGSRARGVALEGEDLLAAHVVIAAGSWSALVAGTPLPQKAVRPVRGQMLELDTRPPALRHLLFGHVPSPADPSTEIAGYLVPRRDGRIVVGSTMEMVGFRKEVTASGLLRLLTLCAGLSPTLASAEVRHTWAGFRPYTPDGLPLLGPTPIAGLHLCTGHHRNGILLAPISAEAICATLTSPLPPVLTSGPLAALDLTPFSVSRLGRNLT